MNRKIVATGVLLTGLLVAMPVLGQAHVWTSDRPDGHAPAGVKSDFLLSFGEIYVGYRYSTERFRGTLVGTQEVSGDEVLDFFTSAPLTHDRWTGEVDVRLGLTNFFTLTGSMPWARNDLLNTTAAAFNQNFADDVPRCPIVTRSDPITSETTACWVTSAESIRLLPCRDTYCILP